MAKGIPIIFFVSSDKFSKVPVKKGLKIEDNNFPRTKI